MSKDMKLIMESWKMHTEYSDLLERHDYIEHVLGVKGLINESGGIYYDKQLKEKIIEEHLILEGFFDDLKKVGGGAMKLLSVFKNFVIQPETIGKWIQAVKSTLIDKNINYVNSIIDNLSQIFQKLKSQTLSDWSQKTKDFLVSILQKIDSLSNSGWKGAIVITSIALATKWFNDKIEPFVEIINKGLPELFKDTAIDEIKEKIEAFVKENLIDPIKTFLIDKVKSILGEVVLSSIAAWYTWAKNSFEGAKFIIDTLDPVLDAL